MFGKSIELGPSYPAYTNLGNLFYGQRRYREAAQAYNQALQLNSKDFRMWGSRAQALRHSGVSKSESDAAFRRAAALGEESLRVEPDDALTLSLLGVYRAALGERAAALSRLDQALTNSHAGRDVFENAAIAFSLLGDPEKALQWTQRALDAGYAWKQLEQDPELDAVLKNPGLRQ